MVRGLLTIVLCLSGVSFAAGRSEVADAAMKGDKAAVRALIAGKADVKSTQVDGATAIHWAAYKDDVEMADLLIHSGARVGVTNREGITPMYLASLNGNSRMIDRLMKAGADPKQRGPYGETMLMLAARNGNPEAITLLISAEVDVNAKEPLRLTTALMWAAEQKHPAAVAALLDGKADFKLKSGAAGVPRNYMPSRVNTSQVEVHAKRYAEAAAAGRTYQEQIDWEEKNGIQHEGRRGFDQAVAAADAGAIPGAAPDSRNGGQDDTETIIGSLLAGHTWQALDYADGLVRVGVQSAVDRPETAALIRKLMIERGLTVPPANRVIESVCIVEICKERVWN